LLVHGLGAHAGRWEAMGDFFLEKGISSYAVELRGPEGGPDRVGNYCSRVMGLYERAARENPAKKIFLVGESFGAIVSIILVARHPGLSSGLICISPAFAPRKKIAFFDCVRILASSLCGSKKEVDLPFDSSMCTRDMDCRNKMEADPREYRSVAPSFACGILRVQFLARSAVKKVRTPTLFLVAGEDRVVNSEQALAAFKSLAAEDKTLVEFPGMYHSLSIELGREKVFEAILKWVEDRKADAAS
jgi:alpha-beta hydrolase superfamily lysophospholipase